MLWFVLQLTGSGAAVGLVILCFDLPGVVTGAILGRLLDRYQPRLVMGFDNLARAALIAAIPTLYALGSLQLWHVFVLALLAGALSPATTAGVRAFVPHLVDDAASFLLMGLLVLTLPTITREPRVAQHAAANRWLGFGVGAFAGVLTLTKLSHRWRPSIALPMIAVLWGALLCPLFFIRQLPLAMLFLGVAGASWAPYTPMETTLLQRLVPAEIRGQVFGARHSLVVAAAPLGAAFGGVLLQYLSAPLVIAISGLACILAGLGGLVSPSLRQLQRGSP